MKNPNAKTKIFPELTPDQQAWVEEMCQKTPPEIMTECRGIQTWLETLQKKKDVPAQMPTVETILKQYNGKYEHSFELWGETKEWFNEKRAANVQVFIEDQKLPLDAALTSYIISHHLCAMGTVLQGIHDNARQAAGYKESRAGALRQLEKHLTFFAQYTAGIMSVIPEPVREAASFKALDNPEGAVSTLCYTMFPIK